MNLERLAATPPATGLLVVDVVAGAPGAHAGIRPGDVIVSCAGAPTATVDALAAAVGAASDGFEIDVVRGARRKTLLAAAGPLGVKSLPVRTGEPLESRPPATPVSLALDRLAAGPLERWYRFKLGGAHVGYEHHVYTLKRDRLTMDFEVAFDGKGWGLNHFIVRLVLGVGDGKPEALVARMETPIVGRTTESRLVRDGSVRGWRTTIRDLSTRAVLTSIAPADALPSYAVAALAQLIWPRRGACLHYRAIDEGSGALDRLGSAILCVGPETVTVNRRPTHVWRFEPRSFGQKLGSTLVDDDGVAVVIDYDTASAHISTEEEALAGVNPVLGPRTA